MKGAVPNNKKTTGKDVLGTLGTLGSAYSVCVFKLSGSPGCAPPEGRGSVEMLPFLGSLGIGNR